MNCACACSCLYSHGVIPLTCFCPPNTADNLSDSFPKLIRSQEVHTQQLTNISIVTISCRSVYEQINYMSFFFSVGRLTEGKCFPGAQILDLIEYTTTAYCSFMHWKQKWILVFIKQWKPLCLFRFSHLHHKSVYRERERENIHTRIHTLGYYLLSDKATWILETPSCL